MGKDKRRAGKGCGILAAIVVGVPLLVAGVVGVQTWGPLHEAGETMDELDRTLGSSAVYCPEPSGAIPAPRMELFLESRSALVAACDDYGGVQQGFEAVAALEERDPDDGKDLRVVGDVATGLGGAALQITPFLARFFERRNHALLAALMGLEEYSYIYAVAYHDLLLAEATRSEIFSGGSALSPEAAEMLRGCLDRQLDAVWRDGGADQHAATLAAELAQMEEDPSRLIWQDGLPAAVAAGIAPYRERLDRVFCAATAGLEMDRSSRRALVLALE